MALKENLSRFIQAIQEDPSHDIEEIQGLITEVGSDEVRSSSKQFLLLCHTLTEALVKTKRSVNGIHLMSIAISKYQNHRSQLTPLHADLCLLCLDSKCLSPALKFLEIDYNSIKRTDDKEEDAKHVQLFHYYGGLIYAAVKNFEQASYFFEVVLTMPSRTMVRIMDEAYKKCVVLNLLLNCKLPENLLPRYTSQCVLRQRKQVGMAYLKLAQEYPSLNYNKIKALVQANCSTFERDENMGLIKQCLNQVPKKNIQRLTKTFLTLPLAEVKNHVGVNNEREAELYILNMIDEGEICATINQKDGMVVFRDNTENYDSVAVFQNLQEDISKTILLINTLKAIDHETPGETGMLLSKMNSEFQ